VQTSAETAVTLPLMIWCGCNFTLTWCNLHVTLTLTWCDVDVTLPLHNMMLMATEI